MTRRLALLVLAALLPKISRAATSSTLTVDLSGIDFIVVKRLGGSIHIRVDDLYNALK